MWFCPKKRCGFERYPIWRREKLENASERRLKVAKKKAKATKKIWRRPALKDGDSVRAFGKTVPDKFFSRMGVVKGVRGSDKTWTVVFSKRKGDWSVFRRKELELAK